MGLIFHMFYVDGRTPRKNRRILVRRALRAIDINYRIIFV